MLASVRALGYEGIELGPPGYLGVTPEAVSAALEPHGLELAGAFAPLRIADEDGFAADLAFLDATVEILAGNGSTGPLVLAADENDVRLAVAGRPESRAATTLSSDDMRRAAERVELAARRALDRGVVATFHPHTATYVESAGEVAALLEATDPDVVKLCVDTGHAIVGGGDPAELVRATRDRIAHLHLKDVDPAVLARVRSGELTAEQAWEQGLFCPFGEGAVDFAAVLAELEGYEGWGVVEQDRVAVRVDDVDAVRAVEVRNLAAIA
jgi:inosose dehydratase